MMVLHTESSLGWGGQELRTVLEANALAIRGYEVRVACSPKSQFGERSELEHGTLIYGSLEKKSVRGLYEAYRILNTIKPDVVITHSSTDSWLFALARHFSKKTCGLVRIRHVRATVEPNFMTRWLYQQAHMVVTTSEDIKAHLNDALKLREESVKSIPTGVDERMYYPVATEARRTLRQQFGMTDGISHLLMVSTLRSWKGHEIVLNALRDLPGTSLHIVGDGPQEAYLRERAVALGLKDRVRFWGHHAEVAGFYQAADVFLQPSLCHEGVSQSLLQAGACQIPVVASDIGGLNEVVAHDQTGLLVPPGDSSALADAIMVCVKNPVEASDRARAFKSKVLEEHTITVMVTRMEQVYRSALHGDRL